MEAYNIPCSSLILKPPLVKFQFAYTIVFCFFTQQLSHKTLVMLLGVDPKSVPDTPFETLTTVKHPRVVFAYLKHMWKEDKQVGMLAKLENT